MSYEPSSIRPATRPALERRLDRLVRDRNKWHLYLFGALGCAYALIGAISLVGKVDLVYVLIYIASFGIASGSFAIMARNLIPITKKTSTVIAYLAYKSARDLAESDLKPSDRRKAVEKTRRLTRRISRWIGYNAPPFIAKPAEDLITAIESRVIPILIEGDTQQIEVTLEPLYDLVVAIDGVPTVESVSNVISRLNSLPSLPQAQSERHSTILERHTFPVALAIGIGIGIVVGVVASIFKAPEYASWLGGSGSAIAVTKLVYDALKKK